ncbi:MAG: UDP-glucose dehydrogenase family protein [Microbacterium sp.]
MRLSVIGCGYLGAVHAAVMASLGHEVIGVDSDSSQIESLAGGRAPFYEPGLKVLLEEGHASGLLSFTTDIAAVEGARIHFVCVGTPQQDGTNAADLRYLHRAIDDLIPHVNPGDVVVGRSTVPVGTASSLAERLSVLGVSLLWNPEFLREGHAVDDTLAPDRIVIGAPATTAGQGGIRTLREAYERLLAADVPLVLTGLETAELAKVAANAFLATKISFANAMAEIADATGADVVTLADAMGHDVRIGRKNLNAGIGFGGGCLPKDLRALAARASELKATVVERFLLNVDEINLRARTRLVDIVVDELGGSVQGRRICILGAAFKPQSDDVRDSPALEVAHHLRRRGAVVVVTDPAAVENARRHHPELRIVEEVDDALGDAEVILVLTDWPQFSQELSPKSVMERTPARMIIDGRNCLTAHEWIDAGWRYAAVGR